MKGAVRRTSWQVYMCRWKRHLAKLSRSVTTFFCFICILLYDKDLILASEANLSLVLHLPCRVKIGMHTVPFPYFLVLAIQEQEGETLGQWFSTFHGLWPLLETQHQWPPAQQSNFCRHFIHSCYSCPLALNG